MFAIGRSVLLVGFAVACIAGPAMAGQCGIGNRLMAGRSGTLPMLGAFTTNVWTLKAVSTSLEIMGCTPSDNLLKRVTSAETRYYAAANFDHIAEDIARGNGETLDGFAGVLGIAAADRADFKNLVQKQFPSLFPDEDVTVDEFLVALGRTMASDHRFAWYL